MRRVFIRDIIRTGRFCVRTMIVLLLSEKTAERLRENFTHGLVGKHKKKVRSPVGWEELSHISGELSRTTFKPPG